VNDVLTTVFAWHEALNTGNLNQLLVLSSPNIELCGPRGSAYGHEELRAWTARAGLSLKPLDVYVKQNTVVVEQTGEWQQDGRTVTQSEVASVFKVVDGQVVYLARFDTLEEAIANAQISSGDLIRVQQ
jgi:hypothetical protein